MGDRVVDLYAGPGGWDEGMRSLGITNVVGIEHDWSACKTAAAAGHRRVQADVLAVPPARFAGYWGLVASPPCQAWSMAGKRLGELDRAAVHRLVDTYAAGGDDPGDDWEDPRSHHTAQPVRWIRELRPEWVCLEQVPGVLTLWQHIAWVIRPWGYSVWTGVLNAANYGVPQTRERAVLIATRTGVATSPTPTHTAEPGINLFGAGLLPWVSMAEALGWEGVDRPARTVCGDRSPRWAYGQGNSYGTGWTLDRRTVSRGRRDSKVPVAPVAAERPAPTLTGQAGNQWVFHRPVTTVAGDPRISRPGHRDRAGGERQHAESLRVGITEAAILQGFPPDYPWHGGKGKQFEQVGNAFPPPLAAAVVAQAVGRG